MTMILKVLHLDTEMTWRGGENQIRLLLEGLISFPIKNYLVAPPESQASLRLGSLCDLRPLPLRGFQQLTAARQIARWVRDEKIHVLDAHTSQAHQLGLLVKLFAPEVRLVVHRRVDFVPGRSVLNRWKYLNRRVDRYVAISEAIAKILVQYGIPAEKVKVVRSAVDPTPLLHLARTTCRNHLAEQLKIDPTLPWIVNAAYLTPQKGHETLLRALHLLQQKKLPFVCLIAGDGVLRDELIALHRHLDLGDNVKFLGIRNDVLQLLKACDILAMPSNYEGLGTTLLDALYAGCCPVATDVGGIPEVVLHEQTGLLSPVGDYRSFSRNLETVLTHESLRAQYVAEGQRHVHEQFSLESMVAGNYKVYNSL